MSRRALGKESIRNIQRSGNSYHMTIPIHLMRELGWQEHQKVVVTRHGTQLRIADWKKV